MLSDHKRHIGERYVEKVVVLGADHQRTAKSHHYYFAPFERRCDVTPDAIV